MASPASSTSLQVGAGGGRVALVEDQVEDVQDHAQAFGPVAREAETLAALPDGLLRAGDAAGHGRLGDQEGAGDLRRGQAADGAQRQRDLGRRGQRRMAAQEEQDQRVVTGGGRVGRDRGPAGRPPPRVPRRACWLRRRSVSRRGGDGDQPRLRVLRRPVGGPLARRPPAAPPGRRPRRCRNGRIGAPGPRGPAARGRAAGPPRRGDKVTRPCRRSVP